MFQKGVYDVCLSFVTLREINKCSEPKRSDLLAYLSKIEYETFEVTDEALRVAHQLISMGILTKKSFDDCQHIAAAILAGCDCDIITSWNLKHIVNVKAVWGAKTLHWKVTRIY